jgi:hypothetical protein
MTRRKHPPARVDPDDYGFDLVGRDWCSTAQERMCLVGLDSLARDLYYTCLRPFADPKTGDVRNASYYRFVKSLTPSCAPRGGRRFPSPTKQQLRDALKRLCEFGLVRLYLSAAMTERALQIRVVRRFGDFSSDSVGPGVGPGVNRPRSRANAG